MERQIRNNYLQLLCRRYIGFALQGLFWLFLFSIAYAGWHFIGGEVGIVIKGDMNTVTSLNILYPVFLTILVLFISPLCFLAIRDSQLEMPKKITKTLFIVYSFFGILFYFSYVQMTPTITIRPVKIVTILGLIVFLYQRYVAIEDDKLIERIFQLEKKRPDVFTGNQFSFPAGWHKYLKQLSGKRSSLKSERLSNLLQWEKNREETELLVCYRVRYSPFVLKMRKQDVNAVRLPWNEEWGNRR